MSSGSTSSSESDLSISSTSDIDFKGTVLKKRYVLIYKLGSGSFSTVWLSYDIHTSKYYAIKMQNPDDYYNGEQEVELFKKFKSKECPYINVLVDSFDYETDDDVYICMVCDLLAGSTFDLVKSGKYNNGLPVDVVKKIIYQLLVAMDYLNKTHKKVHTDIKPENILVVGVSEKIKEIISRFDECGFDKIYKKKKAQSKKKKKGKNNNLNPLEVTIKEVFNKLDLDDLDTSSNEVSETSSVSETSEASSKNETSDDTQVIGDEYLNSDNIITRLSDFGSCLDINNKSYRIQTRYYRSPEVLLGYKLNATCDMWSAGCTLYELLTGSILFDPDKKNRFNRNRYHIYEIQSKLGRIPNYLLNDAEKRSVYFKKNGLMKGSLPNTSVSASANYTPLSSVLRNKLKQTSANELYLIIDLLYKMLEYDPDKRPTPGECLSHPWLNF